MTQDFSAYAMETPGEYTETLGNLINMGYDTDTNYISAPTITRFTMNRIEPS